MSEYDDRIKYLGSSSRKPSGINLRVPLISNSIESIDLHGHQLKKVYAFDFQGLEYVYKTQSPEQIQGIANLIGNTIALMMQFGNTVGSE